MPKIILGKDTQKPLDNDFTKDEEVITAQNQGAESVVLNKPIIEEPVIEQQNKESALQKFKAIEKEYGSYTNYYTETKAHIPGFEYQGDKKLRQERIQREYKEVQDEYVDEDKFLMKNYGYDILADAGEDVRSGGYWYNKIMNNDTTNPLANQYTISKVLEVARNMMELDKVDSTLNSMSSSQSALAQELVGKEISAIQYNDLFESQIDSAKQDEKATEDALKQYNRLGNAFVYNKDSKQVEMPRMLYDDKGDPAYYLHNNNKLYRVVKEDGYNGLGDDTLVAKYDSKNNLIGLQDNNGFMTIGRSVLSGAASALYGFAEIGAALAGFGVDLVQALSGQGFDLGETGEWYGTLQGWKNSASGIFDDGYTDLESASYSGMDIATTVGSVVGSVAAMWLTGAVAAKAATTGAKIIQTGTATGIKKASAYGLKWGGQTVSRLTGMYSGSMGAGVKERLISQSNPILNGVMLAKATAGQHAKTVATYVTKDFLENTAYLSMRKMYDPTFEMDDMTILANSFKSAAIGGLVSSVFAGGRDDSFWRRWGSWTSGLRGIDKLGTGAITNYLKDNKIGVVFVDTIADFIDNLVTMNLAENIRTTGKVEVTAPSFEGIVSAAIMAGVTGYGSHKNGIDVRGKILRDLAPEVQKEIADKAKQFRLSGKEAEAASLLGVLKLGDENRRKSIAGKINELSPELQAVYGDLKDTDIIGNEFLADLVYLETIKQYSSSDLIESKLNKANINNRIEMYNIIGNEVKKTISDVSNKLSDSANQMSREGVAKVLFDNSERAYKRLTKETKKLYIDMFTKDQGTETFHMVPFTVKDIEELYNEKYLDFEPANKEALENIIDHKHTVTDKDSMYKPLVREFGTNAIFQELTTGNTATNLQTESIAAAKFLSAIAAEDGDVSFTYKEIEGRHFVVIKGKDEITTSYLINLHNKASEAINSIKADMSSDSIWNLARVFTGEGRTGKEPTLKTKVKLIIATLNKLKDLDIIDARRSAIVLRKFISDKGFDDSKVDNTIKTSSIYREYKFVKILDKIEDKIQSGKATNDMVLADMQELFKYSEGDEPGEVKPIYSNLLERDEYKNRINNISEAYRKLSFKSPSKPLQLVNKLSQNNTKKKRYIKPLERKFGVALRTVDELDNIGDSTYNRSLVVIDLSTFKTKAEKDNAREAINAATQNDQIVKYNENKPIEVEKDSYNQLSYKQAYINNSDSSTLTFDVDSDEFYRFASDMGYEYSDELLEQQGVSRPKTKTFKINITNNQRDIINKSKSQRVSNVLISKSDNLKLQAANNSKSEVHIDDESLISVKKLADIILDDITYHHDDEVSSSTTFAEAIKAAVGGGKNKLKNFIVRQTSKAISGSLNKNKINRLYLETIFNTLKSLPDGTSLEISDQDFLPKYRDTKFLIFDVDDSGDKLTLKLNKSKLESLINKFNEKGLKNVDLFTLVPLIPNNKTDFSDPNTKGINRFINKESSITDKDIVKAFVNFISLKYGKIINVETLLKDLENEKKIGTTYYNKPFEIKNDMTIEELKDLLQSKEAEKNNLFLDDLRIVYSVLESLKNKTVTNRNVNILVTDSDYRNLIIEGVIKKKTPEDIYEDIKDIVYNKEDGASTPTQDHVEDLQRDNVIGAGDIINNLVVKNNLSNIDNKEDIVKDINSAIKILTEGVKEPKEIIKTEIKRSINNLKTFVKNGVLELPFEEITRLSDEEIEFLKTIPEAKSVLYLRDWWYRDIPDLKQESLKENLTDAEAPSTIQLDDKANIENKKTKAEIRSAESNNGITRRLSNLVEKIDDETFNKIFESILGKLDNFETQNLGIIYSYDLTTQQGRDVFVNHLDSVYEELYNDVFGRGSTITEEIEDNLLDTAIEILAHNKGTSFTNEYKNSFVIGNDGKVIASSRISRNEIDFNKMIISTPDEKLRGNTLFVPDRDSFDSLDPQLKSLKLDDDNIAKLKVAALVDIIKSGGKIDANIDQVKEYITRVFSSPQTSGDVYNRGYELLTELGLGEELSKVLIRKPFKVEIKDSFAGESAVKAEENKINDAIEYGVGETERSSFSNIVKELDQNIDGSNYDTKYPKNNLNKKFTKEFAKLSSQYFSKLYHNSNTRTVDIDNTEVETLKEKINYLYNKYYEDVKGDAELLKELKAFASKEIMRSYLTNYRGAETIKFVSDTKKFNRRKLNVDNDNLLVPTTGESSRYHIDTETIFGEIFKLTILKTDYKDGEIVNETSTDHYNTEVFKDNSRRSLAGKLLESPEEITDAELSTLKLTRDFIKDNDGYFDALDKLSDARNTDFDKDYINKLFKEHASEIVGYNTKGKNSDIDWLLASEIIDTDTADKLRTDSIDLYNDIVLPFGIELKVDGETTHKKKLETIVQHIREIGDIDDNELRTLHDSSDDVIATRYAHKLLSNMVNENNTDEIRMKHKTVFNASTKDFNFIDNREAYKYADTLSKEFRKVAPNLIRYDNTDKNIRKARTIVQSIQDYTKYKKSNRELNKQVEKASIFSADEIKAIRSNEYNVALKHISLVAKLISGVNDIDEASLKLSADIVERALEKANNSQYGFNKDRIRKQIVTSSSFNDKFYDTLLRDERIRKGWPLDTIDVNEFKSKIDREGIDQVSKIINSLDKDYTSVNNQLLLQPLFNLRNQLLKYGRDTLHIDNEKDLKDFINIMSTVATVDAGNTRNPEIGISYSDADFSDKIEKIIESAIHPELEGSFVMAQPKRTESNSTEIEISKDLLKYTIDIDGENYLYMVRYPNVITGGKLYKVDVIDNNTENYIGINPTLFKSVHQGDFDSDDVSIQDILNSSIKPAKLTESQKELVRVIYKVNSELFKERDIIIDEASKYIRDYSGESKDTKEILAKAKAMNSKELKKQVLKDIQEINSTKTAASREALYKKKSSDPIYNVDYKDKDGNNRTAEIFEECIVPVTSDPNESKRFKVVSILSSLPIDKELRSFRTRKHLTLKPFATYSTQLAGSLYKHRTSTKFETDMPLKEFNYGSIELADSDKDILRNSINKAKKENDIIYLTKLGVDINEDTEESIAKIQLGLNDKLKQTIDSPELNKEFGSALAKFLEDPYKSEVHTILNELKDFDLEPSDIDYVTSLNTSNDLNDILMSYALKYYSDAYGIDKIKGYTDDKLGDKFKIAFVDFASLGIVGEEDTSFLLNDNKLMPVKREKELQVRKDEYDRLSELLSEDKKQENINKRKAFKKQTTEYINVLKESKKEETINGLTKYFKKEISKQEERLIGLKKLLESKTDRKGNRIPTKDLDLIDSEIYFIELNIDYYNEKISKLNSDNYTDKRIAKSVNDKTSFTKEWIANINKEIEHLKNSDSIGVYKAKDIYGNSVTLDPKTNSIINITKGNLIEVDGKYYLRYTTTENINAQKFNGFKSVSGKVGNKEVRDKLSFLNNGLEDADKFDLVMDIKHWNKKKSFENNLTEEVHNIGGNDVIVTNRNMLMVDYQSEDKKSKRQKFNTNGLLQTSLNSPEAALIYGDLLFSVNDGKVIANSDNIMDIIDKVKYLKKTPIYKEGNALYKLQIVQALTLKDLIEKNVPSVAAADDYPIDTQFCLKNKNWGSQEGIGNINWMKKILTDNIRSETNTNLDFNDVLEKLGREDLIPLFDDRNVTDHDVISPTQTDDEAVHGKANKAYEKTSGSFGSQNNTFSEGPSNRISKRITGKINHDDLYNMLGIYGNTRDIMNLSYRGYGDLVQTQRTGQGNNFEDVPIHLLEDDGVSVNTGIVDANKGGLADVERQTYIDITDHNRVSKPIKANVSEYALSHLDNIAYGLRLEEDLKSLQAQPVNLAYGRTSLGTLYKLLNMEDKSAYSIFKTFGDNEYVDNVEYSKLDRELELNPETNRFEFKEIPKRLKGDLEKIEEKIKSKSFSPYFYNNDNDLDLKLNEDKLNEIRNSQDISKSIDNMFEDVDQTSFLPLTIREQAYFKELDIVTTPDSTIIDSEGVTKSLVFKPNKSAIGNDEVKTNYLAPAGVGYKTDAGFNLNMIAPDAENASIRAVGPLLVSIKKLDTLLNTKEIKTEFSKYIKARLIQLESKAGNEALKEHISTIGFKSESEMNIFMSEFELLNPGVVSCYYNVTKGLLEYRDKINKGINEPFDTFLLLAPYIEPSKEKRKQRTRDTLNNMINIDGDAEYMLLKNTSDDYLNSVKSISGRIKSAYRASTFSQLLKINGLITNNEAIESSDLSTEEFEELVSGINFKDGYDLMIDKVIEVVNTIAPSERGFKQMIKIDGTNYSKESLIDCYTRVSNYITNNKFGYLSTDELQLKLNTSKNATEIIELERLKNLKDIKAGLIYDTIKHNKMSVNKIYNKLVSQGLKTFGSKATLVDMYGREIKYNTPFKALYEGSGEYIGRTLRFQGSDEEEFKRNVVAEAIKGNVYYGNKTLSDQLDKHVYVEREFVGQRTLSKIGKTIQTLIMSNPAKFGDRLLTYSAFDIAQGIMVNPKSIMYLPRAMKDLKAFYQSNGSVMSEDLKHYYYSKGFSSKEASSRDIITRDIEETDSKRSLTNNLITDITKEGFDLQSDMYRYTLYLAMKDSFENDKGIYGPTYGIKDKIDNIRDQTEFEANLLGYDTPLTAEERKAYQVVSYTYGNPGTFPIAAKKLKGLMVFNTFPLTFIRSTLGFASGTVKGLEMAIKEHDAKGIFKNALVPGLGLIGITLMYNLFIDGVSELYGVEDEDKEQIKKEQRNLAPIGTLLFGTPVFNYDSFNPYQILKDMTTKPITDSINDKGEFKLEEAILRFLSTNALSRLNPAAKGIVEVATQKDLIGSDIADNKYEYTFIENMFRKLLSFPAGSSGAKAIVDAFGLRKYNNDPITKTLVDGASRAVLAELGNTKAYKKEKSNYYRTRQLLSAQKVLENNIKYPEYEEEDLFNNSIYASKNDYSKEDASKLYSKLNKALRNEESPSVIHNIILSAIDTKGDGMSTTTVNSVLNNISIERKLNTMDDKDTFINSLNEKQKEQLQDAINYENAYFPTIKDIELREDYYEKQPYINKHYTKKPYSNVRAPYLKNIYYKSPYYNINSKYNKPEITKVSKKMGLWDNKY